MDYLKIIVACLSAAGLWKFMEFLLRMGVEKKHKKAEIDYLHTQTNHQIVRNWIEWSQKLEKQVKDLESDRQEMQRIIKDQTVRINKLEEQISTLEQRNQELTDELNNI